MGITDEQYGQISRYVTGEMEAAEGMSFEESLKANAELAAEMKRCRQIQALFASAAKKLEQHYQSHTPEKNESEEDVANLITQARTDWEKSHEDLKPDHPNRFLQTKKKEGIRKIRLSLWVWLAAAAVIGLAGFGVWFILQKEPPLATARQNGSKNTVTVSKEVNPVLPQEDSATRQIVLLRNETVEKAIDTKALFAQHFIPDAAPADREPQQEVAFTFYTAKNYPAAIEDFEMWKATLETRGDRDRAVNTPFYIHYYLALSYLSGGKNIKKAIDGLMTAVQTTASPALKQKASWYLALANLKAGNVTETRTLLQQLEPSTARGQKAAELLQTLNSNQ